MWDARTGEPIREPLIHPNTVWSIACSPDGKMIAAGCNDHNIYIWDIQTGAQAMEPMKGHTNVVQDVSFSPNGRYVASSSDDATVRVWDLETQKDLFPPLEGHTEGLNDVVYSPDGQYVASAGDDGTIQIWDARKPADIDNEFLQQDASLDPKFAIDRSVSDSSDDCSSTDMDPHMHDDFFELQVDDLLHVDEDGVPNEARGVQKEIEKRTKNDPRASSAAQNLSTDEILHLDGDTHHVPLDISHKKTKNIP
ncbi:WD40-repeat-containing domain protein, partial [Crucibulum laeve]